MLASLRDESLFSSLRSDNNKTYQHGRTKKFGRFPQNLPEDYIKKRVASQLSSNRGQILLNSTATKRSTRAESNPRFGSKTNTNNNNNQDTTDYISLNKRMQLLSRTMGREANMGATSFRRHGDGAINASFPLT